MTIAVLKESKKGETRVALTPDVVKSLTKKGFKIIVEKGAGESSFFYDEDYKSAGAEIVSAEKARQGGIVLKVNAPTLEEASKMNDKACSISLLYAYTQPELLDVFNKKSILSFGMDAIPRISRAQRMDALSSQSNLAGYKSVIIGSDRLSKIFPLMMTAAGTITPAKVLIFGAGVAGLQAIATAKRLGAVVEVTDVRPETKEQVESLGGRFLVVEDDQAGVKTEGGYAREVSADFLQKQKELIEERIKEADLVITTALVIGKKSPVLVTKKMVDSMKKGAVIVDMAVEWGGNCELSEAGKTVVHNGVSIIGEPNLPALLPLNASQLYATNISTLLLHLADANGFIYDKEDEITKGCMITTDGQTVHEFTNQILNKNK